MLENKLEHLNVDLPDMNKHFNCTRQPWYGQKKTTNLDRIQSK